MTQLGQLEPTDLVEGEAFSLVGAPEGCLELLSPRDSGSSKVENGS